MAKYNYNKLNRIYGDFPEYYVAENGEAIRVTLEDGNVYAERGNVVDDEFKVDSEYSVDKFDGTAFEEAWTVEYLDAYGDWLIGMGCE